MRQTNSNFTHVLFPEESKIFFLSFPVSVKGVLKCKNMPTENEILLRTLHFKCKEFRKIWVAFCEDKITKYRE